MGQYKLILLVARRGC